MKKPGRPISEYNEKECFWCSKLGIFKRWIFFCSERCYERYRKKGLREYSRTKHQYYLDLNKALDEEMNRRLR